MVKTGQIKYEKPGRHVAAMHNLLQCFLLDCVTQNYSFVSEQDLAM